MKQFLYAIKSLLLNRARSLTFHQNKQEDGPDLRAATNSRRSWQTRLAIILICSAVLSGFATYGALTETPPFGNDSGLVIWLLNIDLIILSLLVMLIAQRVVGLWSGRKRGLAGSQLNVKLVYIFSVLAAVPMILMTVFSAFFFHFGVQTWFSDRVQTAVNESQAVAQSYLHEHQQVIRADVLAMANDLDRQADVLILNRAGFQKFMETQSLFRNLSEAIIFNQSGEILAQSGLSLSLQHEDIPPYGLTQADEGQVVMMTGDQDNRVRALVKLRNFGNSYLFVSRQVDPKVLAHLTATQEAAQDYADLQARYSGLQVTVTMIFVLVGLLLVCAAIWFGLILARQLSTPISQLIIAADRVRAGDLTSRVPDNGGLEEFDYLAQAFNRMTRQIQQQQGELIAANRQLDQRRRFIETVLGGVSSGVMGIDVEGKITLANAAAARFLRCATSDLLGRYITEVIPELSEPLSDLHQNRGEQQRFELSVMVQGKTRRNFIFHSAVELIGNEDRGTILTFDDISELQSAQRKAAWSDVARRIAHEIKNPLTPIQLSAERLRRRYMEQISSDPEIFAQCVDTIIKNVSDIGRMVDEFSAFARMPEPVMQENDIYQTLNEAIVLQRSAHQNIEITLGGKPLKGPISVYYDARQLRQVLNNLLQNAIDSLNQQQDKKKTRKIAVTYKAGRDDFMLCVSDSGPGFPSETTHESLLEPYVTHKEKGTGLGLAIVKKIIEDHEGTLILGDDSRLHKMAGWKDFGGAHVTFILPRRRNLHVDKSAEDKNMIKAKNAA